MHINSPELCMKKKVDFVMTAWMTAGHECKSAFVISNIYNIRIITDMINTVLMICYWHFLGFTMPLVDTSQACSNMHMPLMSWCSAPPPGKCVFTLVHIKTHTDRWLHASTLHLYIKPRTPSPYLSLHSVGAIAPVVHCSRDGDNESRHSISCQVEVLGPGVLAFKHLHQHDVELYSFQEHPGKGCQEEKMEQGSKDGTGNLERKDGKGLYKHHRTGNVSFCLHFHWWIKNQISNKHSMPEVHQTLLIII